MKENPESEVGDNEDYVSGNTATARTNLRLIYSFTSLSTHVDIFRFQRPFNHADPQNYVIRPNLTSQD